MKVHVFGTAASEGWPALFCHCEACERARTLGGKNIRTRAGALIDGVIKLDFGPDTFMQALRDGIELAQIQHFLFTHTHLDHFAPREFLFYQEPYAWRHPNHLYIYGNERALVKCASDIQELGNGTTFEYVSLQPFLTINISGIEVTPLVADHDPKETCLIYVFEKDGKSLLWGHDTGYFPEETWTYLTQRAKTKPPLSSVFLDCTCGDSRDTRGHMGIYANRLVKERMLADGIADGTTRFVITHFSHNTNLMHDEFEALVEPDGFVVAYDGMDWIV
ncbi:MAG: carbon-phosphorus lyase [Alicyclobacillus sp.]|nr:carbon-phosphorus lyase [Alicyclobacillus sp.]